MTSEQFDTILINATKRVGADYFLLQIDGGEARSRERVYCYELYHQMRRRWPRDARLVLNGEVDKNGHPKLRPLGVGGIPDFLVHLPGDMGGNHTIVEVKPAENTSKAKIEVDLVKLSQFVSLAQYRRAIYLIYGARARAMVARIDRAFAGIASQVPIELWLHLSAGESARFEKIVGS